MSQESVQKVIPFTASDLEANRRFEVTTDQLNHLRSELDRIYKGAVCVLIISIICPFILAATGQFAVLIPFTKSNFESALTKQLLLFFIALIIFAFIVSILIILGCLIKYRNYKEKLTVRVVEGKVERISDEYSNIVKIGDVEFHLIEKEYNAFTGDYYRAYYLDSNEILSVESPETKI